jgi:hypothetical protein
LTAAISKRRVKDRCLVSFPWSWVVGMMGGNVVSQSDPPAEGKSDWLDDDGEGGYFERVVGLYKLGDGGRDSSGTDGLSAKFEEGGEPTAGDGDVVDP